MGSGGVNDKTMLSITRFTMVYDGFKLFITRFTDSHYVMCINSISRLFWTAKLVYNGLWRIYSS